MYILYERGGELARGVAPKRISSIIREKEEGNTNADPNLPRWDRLLRLWNPMEKAIFHTAAR